MPDMEVHMPLTVILAVGLDPSLPTAQNAAWKSAGYIVISVGTIKEAIDHFRAGDFDLVLLGNSLPLENKERLTFLIRSSGSRTPVVCVANLAEDCGRFADATLKNDSGELLSGIQELLAKSARMRAVKQDVCENSN